MITLTYKPIGWTPRMQELSHITIYSLRELCCAKVAGGYTDFGMMMIIDFAASRAISLVGAVMVLRHAALWTEYSDKVKGTL